MKETLSHLQTDKSTKTKVNSRVRVGNVIQSGRGGQISEDTTAGKSHRDTQHTSAENVQNMLKAAAVCGRTGTPTLLSTRRKFKNAAAVDPELDVHDNMLMEKKIHI